MPRRLHARYGGNPEPAGVVALLADRAERPVVHIVLLVAINAAAADFDFVDRLRVACGAGDAGVQADEREAGLRMVEFRDFPSGLAVAAFAFGPVHAFVDILARMAAHAGHRRGAWPGGACVAARAGDRAVRPAQGEGGDAFMIERDRAPVGGKVAIRAARTIGPVVDILLQMARDAGGRYAVPLLLHMAGKARCRPVRPG